MERGGGSCEKNQRALTQAPIRAVGASAVMCAETGAGMGTRGYCVCVAEVVRVGWRWWPRLVVQACGV